MVEVRTPSNKLLLGSISPGVYFDICRWDNEEHKNHLGLNPVSRLEFILTFV